MDTEEETSSHILTISDELIFYKACMNSETQSTEMILKEKLLAALESIKEKESLVNEHARVAEEAITGWEKAEKEASDLKQKASSLEDRVIQLDGALKECLKQLREATRIDLKLELQERYEELEILTIERDRSIQLIENVSKQHLESIKKVSELETECQRLKDCLVGRNKLVSHSVEIIRLMDDFLEMERLVALEEANKNESFLKTSKAEIPNRSFSIDSQYEKIKGNEKTTRDKEMAIATSRLEDCMETIASLNRQLKSIATFEDFFVDVELSIDDVPKNEMLHLNWSQVAIL